MNRNHSSQDHPSRGRRFIGFDDPHACHRVRDVFTRANYSEAGIIELLGYKVPVAPIAVEMPPFVLRTNGGTPLETLIRLFLLNLPTDLAATRHALQPMALEQWAEAGLVVTKNDTVVPAVRLLPYQGLLLACDVSQNTEIANQPNFVMGLGGSSLSLMNSTIRKPVGSTLDLGTGCGVQAFLLRVSKNHIAKRNSFTRFRTWDCRMRLANLVICSR